MRNDIYLLFIGTLGLTTITYSKTGSEYLRWFIIIDIIMLIIATYIKFWRNKDEQNID